MIVAVSEGVSVGGIGVHVAVREGVSDGVLVSVAGAKIDNGLPRQLAKSNISMMGKAIFLDRGNFGMSRLYRSFSRASFMMERR